MSAAGKLLCWFGMAAVLCAAACQPAPGAAPQGGETSAPLQVFAAASLSESFEALGARYTAKTGDTVTFNFAGSQMLSNQINEGAPADVFASANPQQMERVVAAGLAVEAEVRVFARNRLVVAVARDSADKVQTLEDLSQAGLHLVLGAKEVPAGEYTLEFLEKAAADPAFGPRYREAVLNNVISYEENVRIVLTRVMLGEADAGILYATDVAGSADAGLALIEIPASLNITADYPIVPLSGSPRAQSARAFVDFVLSEEGQSILAEYGFIPAR